MASLKEVWRLLMTYMLALPAWCMVAIGLAGMFTKRRDCFNNKRAKRLAQADIKHPEVNGVTHEYVQAGGLQIHVARAGVSKSKDLVLCIHGFPEFWYSWRHQIETLQQQYEVAAIDLPGYNASEVPKDRSSYLVNNLAGTVADVVRELGRQSCIVIAHDWGGGIACDFAQLYPQMVQRLALLASVPMTAFKKNMDSTQRSASWYFGAFLAPKLPELWMAANDYELVASMFANPKLGGTQRLQLADEEVACFKDAMARPGCLTAAFDYYRVLQIEDSVFRKNTEAYVARKERFKMPTMIVFGDHDLALTPNLLRKIGRIMPDVRVHILPNCSHWVQQDAVEDTNRLLADFLKGA